MPKNAQPDKPQSYMMYAKAILFNDEESAHRILNRARTPRSAKRMGKKVNNFNEETWTQHKQKIVIRGLYFKFSRNKSLRDRLMATGVRALVEASPSDRIWGIGYS